LKAPASFIECVKARERFIPKYPQGLAMFRKTSDTDDREEKVVFVKRTRVLLNREVIFYERERDN